MFILRPLLALFLFLPLVALGQQPLPTLQAEVDQPVVQELMGGCSLACAFPWETKGVSPGGSPYPIYTLKDDDKSTAWIDTAPGSSIGTKLVFEFPKKLIKELQGTPFYGFDIANGNLKSDNLWREYSRVKKVKMFYNGKPLYYIAFSDSKRWQKVSFDDIFIKAGDSMALQIVEVYLGTKSPNVAVTELVLQGAH
jgi:hypothetical protein